MNVRLLEQFAPDGFARAAFEEHVVRQHHRRASVLLEDGEDVMEEIELLVAGACLEIVAVDDERFLRRLARLVDDGHAALFAEGRIGQDDLVFAVLRDDSRRRARRAGRRDVLALWECVQSSGAFGVSQRLGLQAGLER